MLRYFYLSAKIFLFIVHVHVDRIIFFFASKLDTQIVFHFS